VTKSTDGANWIMVVSSARVERRTRPRRWRSSAGRSNNLTATALSSLATATNGCSLSKANSAPRPCPSGTGSVQDHVVRNGFVVPDLGREHAPREREIPLEKPNPLSLFLFIFLLFERPPSPSRPRHGICLPAMFNRRGPLGRPTTAGGVPWKAGERSGCPGRSRPRHPHPHGRHRRGPVPPPLRPRLGPPGSAPAAPTFTSA